MLELLLCCLGGLRRPTVQRPHFYFLLLHVFILFSGYIGITRIAIFAEPFQEDPLCSRLAEFEMSLMSLNVQGFGRAQLGWHCIAACCQGSAESLAKLPQACGLFGSQASSASSSRAVCALIGGRGCSVGPGARA
jgi:hypothetical protein